MVYYINNNRVNNIAEEYEYERNIPYNPYEPTQTPFTPVITYGRSNNYNNNGSLHVDDAPKIPLKDIFHLTMC